MENIHMTGKFQGAIITILGTRKEPLFLPEEIGKIIGIDILKKYPKLVKLGQGRKVYLIGEKSNLKFIDTLTKDGIIAIIKDGYTSDREFMEEFLKWLELITEILVKEDTKSLL